MDNQLPQSTPLEPVTQPRKIPVKTTVIVVLLLGIGVIFGYSMYSRGTKDQKTNTSAQGSNFRQSSNLPPLPTTSQQTIGEPIDIVQNVTSHIKTGTFEEATKYFYLDEKSGYTKEEVMTLLTNDKTAFSGTDGYRPLISKDNIETMGTQSQILVEYTVSDKKYTARYDLSKKGTAWKIVNVTYNSKINLTSIVRLSSVKSDAENRIPYSASPITISLPNADTVELKKTIIKPSAGEDVVLTFNNPKSSYVIVVYDNGRPIVVEYVTKGETERNAVHIFDGRDLEENHGGIIAIYPEGKVIDRSVIGVADGTLQVIPIKTTK